MPAPTWSCEREKTNAARDFHDSFGKKFRAASSACANTTQSIIIIILSPTPTCMHTRRSRVFSRHDCCNLRLFSPPLLIYTPNLAPAASETTHSFRIRCAHSTASSTCVLRRSYWEFIHFFVCESGSRDAPQMHPFEMNKCCKRNAEVSIFMLWFPDTHFYANFTDVARQLKSCFYFLLIKFLYLRNILVIVVIKKSFWRVCFFFNQ